MFWAPHRIALIGRLNASLDLARDVATFNLLRLYRNSIPRGASSGLEVAIE
jgi:hypothetical protein